MSIVIARRPQADAAIQNLVTPAKAGELLKQDSSFRGNDKKEAGLLRYARNDGEQQ